MTKSPISFAILAFAIQLQCDQCVSIVALFALAATNRKIPQEQMRPILWAQFRNAKSRARAVTAITGLHFDSPWLALQCWGPSTDSSEAPLQSRSREYLKKCLVDASAGLLWLLSGNRPRKFCLLGKK
jgi:hypothetical protein